ncbi:MAG: hypothetical protein AAF766_15640 [Cyanobacteria bacterium P01_D01_bin.14]
MNPRLKRISWKPLRWWLVALVALVWALWANGRVLPAYAGPGMTDAGSSTFKIGGDLVVTGPDPIEEAFAIGGDLTVAPGTTVEGDAFAVGGNLVLSKNVQVGGDAFAVGGRLIRDETAVVRGDTFTVMEQLSGVFSRFGVLGTLYLGHVTFWTLSFVLAAIAGLIFLTLLPDHINAVTAAVYDRPLTSLLYGLGGFASLTLLSILLSGSVLGALLIPLANLGALLTGLFGGTAVAVWLGERLRRQHLEAKFQHFWIGLLVLFLVSLIPFIGGLLISLLVLFGFGATLLVRYGIRSVDTQPPSDLANSLDRLEHQPE